MASTSTQLQQDGASLPSGSSSWKYDVFLSFRGQDTRDGFVDHLYSVLLEKVIFTFKDDQRLERGESISPTLLKAIEESRFVVVVFSENYASSKWCLKELVKILACKKERGLTVLTVFYNVDPSDLWKQSGSVQEAFTRHKRDSSEEEVQIWRNALTEGASIIGWDSKTHRGKVEVNDLKKNEIIFYFRNDERRWPKVIAPVKCAVHALYENDEEWPADLHSSIQLSDCDDEYGSIERTQGVVLRKRSCHDHDDYKADAREQSNPKRLREDVVQGRDSQSELLEEISIENIINSKPELVGYRSSVGF